MASTYHMSSTTPSSEADEVASRVLRRAKVSRVGLLVPFPHRCDKRLTCRR